MGTGAGDSTQRPYSWSARRGNFVRHVALGLDGHAGERGNAVLRRARGPVRCDGRLPAGTDRLVAFLRAGPGLVSTVDPGGGGVTAGTRRLRQAARRVSG